MNELDYKIEDVSLELVAAKLKAGQAIVISEQPGNMTVYEMWFVPTQAVENPTLEAHNYWSPNQGGVQLVLPAWHRSMNLHLPDRGLHWTYLAEKWGKRFPYEEDLKFIAWYVRQVSTRWEGATL